MLISEYEIDKDDCDQGDVGQVLVKTNYAEMVFELTDEPGENVCYNI